MTHSEIVAALRYGDRVEHAREHRHDVYPARRPAARARVNSDLPYAGGRPSDDFAGCYE